MSKILPLISHRLPQEEILLSTSGGGIPIVKSQSYIAILEDALEQLAVLEDITPELLKTDNKQVLGFNKLAEKVTKILLEQKQLQEKHQELVVERESSKTLSNKTKYKEIQANLTDIATQLDSLSQSSLF
jgi:hypothetical protein